MSNPSSEHSGQDAGAELPRAFGRYVLFDHIGRGGMADIYLAKMRNSLGGARNVVVKEVLPELSASDSFGQMLIAEAKLAAQLNHASVVQVFDLGREAERLFIAMDYVEGFDLHQLLRRLSKAKLGLPAEFALLIIREVLRALDYAHRAKDEAGEGLGIVHRDVSPSNVLVSFEGEVKLCDFGIARAMRSREDASPKVAGKSGYMAPEHARGEDIDARADVFAAGILLWELVAGRRLYKGKEEQLRELAKAAEIPPLPDRGMPAPQRLQGILDKALAADAAERFESAAIFLDALETYAIEERLMASPLRLGSFLTDHFAEDIVSLRRTREKAAESLDDGADWSTFGPSSAPPPAANAEDIAIPKAPKVPLDAFPSDVPSEPALDESEGDVEWDDTERDRTEEDSLQAPERPGHRGEVKAPSLPPAALVDVPEADPPKRPWGYYLLAAAVVAGLIIAALRA